MYWVQEVWMSRHGKLLFVDSTAQLQKRGSNDTQTLCYFDLEVVSDWTKNHAVSKVTSPPMEDTQVFANNDPVFFNTKPKSNLFVSQ